MVSSELEFTLELLLCYFLVLMVVAIFLAAIGCIILLCTFCYYSYCSPKDDITSDDYAYRSLV